MTIDMLATLADVTQTLDANLAMAQATRRELLDFNPSNGKLLQELLSVNGFPTAVDGDVGKNTKAKLSAYRRSVGFSPSSDYDRPTFTKLVEPIIQACALPTTAAGARASVVAVAFQHSAAKAREIPPNSGPWVRLYMSGNQGAPWAWCAGFASFVWIQAAAALAQSLRLDPAPLVEKARRYRTFSCDVLAQRAQADGTFIEGGEVAAGHKSVMPGDLFLIQKSARDWVHVGLVVGVRDGRTIRTVEGNTNTAGGREGLYVLERTRSIPTSRNSGMDFIRLPFA